MSLSRSRSPWIPGLLLLGLAACRSDGEVRPTRPAPELSGTILAVDDKLPPDPELEALIAPYRVAVEAEMRELVATAPAPIERRNPEGPLGNLVADAIRAGGAEATGKPVDLAFNNSGGIRNNIPAGPITVGTLFEVMPFDNSIVVFELKGESLQRTLDSAAGRGGDPISGGRLVISRGAATQVTIGGRPLDPERTYRVATNDYVFDGGGRFGGLKDASKVVRTGVLLRDALIEHVRRVTNAEGQLIVAVDGRVQKQEQR